MHYPAAEKYACLGEKRMDESHFSYRSNSPVKLGNVMFVKEKALKISWCICS